jgi:hypothetical protein
MREYAKISSSFWTGKTGRAIRGDSDAQIVALYLLTSPHANMIGVFYCPIAYISHETGSPLEGASKGLRRLIEEGFCTYDEDSETVWVHEMARFQIGDTLKASDNRIKDIRKRFEEIQESQIRRGFYAKYKEAFHLVETTVDDKPLPSPFEAPSKPLRSQEQEQEQELTPKAGEPSSEEIKASTPPAPSSKKSSNSPPVAKTDFPETPNLSAGGFALAEPELLPTPTPVVSLPLNDGSEYGVIATQVAEWSAAYPNVDVPQQLRNMRQWCLAKPKRRKTQRGVLAFVVGWLAREQDRGPPRENRSAEGGIFDGVAT